MWTAPVDDGGVSILDYTVTVTAPGGGEATGVTGDASREVDGDTTAFGFTGLTNGTEYEFTVAATNLVGTGDPSDPATATPDGDAPSPSLNSLSTWRLTNSVPVEWSATDANSGVASYDVGRQGAAYNASLGSWNAWKTDTASTSSTYNGSFGSTYCFRARATDNADNTSAFTPSKCTAIPMTASQFGGSGWSSNKSSDAFAGKYRKATKAGASLSKSGIKAKRVALIVTKCSKCGKVKVYWNGVYRKTVDLRASPTRRKQTVSVLSFSKVSTGTLKLVVATVGKPVPIEGVGVTKL
jgi:hypothetical protein